MPRLAPLQSMIYMPFASSAHDRSRTLLDTTAASLCHVRCGGALGSVRIEASPAVSCPKRLRRFAALSTLILVPTDVATALEEQRPPWLSLWWRIAYWCARPAVKPSFWARNAPKEVVNDDDVARDIAARNVVGKDAGGSVGFHQDRNTEDLLTLPRRCTAIRMRRAGPCLLARQRA